MAELLQNDEAESGGVGVNDSYMDVLQQYEGETLNVRRGRGAWICEQSDGIRLLKEYRGTLRRLEFEEAVKGIGKRRIRPGGSVCAQPGRRADCHRGGWKQIHSEKMVSGSGMQSAGQQRNPDSRKQDCGSAPGISENFLA